MCFHYEALDPYDYMDAPLGDQVASLDGSERSESEVAEDIELTYAGWSVLW